jgi:hypothetical protein
MPVTKDSFLKVINKLSAVQRDELLNQIRTLQGTHSQRYVKNETVANYLYQWHKLVHGKDGQPLDANQIHNAPVVARLIEKKEQVRQYTPQQLTKLFKGEEPGEAPEEAPEEAAAAGEVQPAAGGAPPVEHPPAGAAPVQPSKAEMTAHLRMQNKERLANMRRSEYERVRGIREQVIGGWSAEFDKRKAQAMADIDKAVNDKSEAETIKSSTKDKKKKADAVTASQLADEALKKAKDDLQQVNVEEKGTIKQGKNRAETMREGYHQFEKTPEFDALKKVKDDVTKVVSSLQTRKRRVKIENEGHTDAPETKIPDKDTVGKEDLKPKVHEHKQKETVAKSTIQQQLDKQRDRLKITHRAVKYNHDFAADIKKSIRKGL